MYILLYIITLNINKKTLSVQNINENLGNYLDYKTQQPVFFFLNNSEIIIYIIIITHLYNMNHIIPCQRQVFLFALTFEIRWTRAFDCSFILFV